MDALDHRVESIASHGGEEGAEMDFAEVVLDGEGEDFVGGFAGECGDQDGGEAFDHGGIAGGMEEEFAIAKLGGHPDIALAAEDAIGFGAGVLGEGIEGIAEFDQIGQAIVGGITFSEFFANGLQIRQRRVGRHRGERCVGRRD